MSSRAAAPLAGLLCAGIVATAAAADSTVEAGEAGAADAAAAAAPQSALNVAIVVFEAASAQTQQRQRSEELQKLHDAEARFLPYELRGALVETGQWGTVRVLPEPDPTAELLVYGSVIESDGVDLTLHLRAVDGTGREWVNETYGVSATADDRTDFVAEPFRQLYERFADDLADVRSGLSDRDLAVIVEVSLLRYAESLAPGAFDGYLQHDASGEVRIRRLPARGDPMLARVERIRETERSFTDTMDAQFLELYEELAPVYRVWREHRRDLALSSQSEAEWRANRKSRDPRGSFVAMRRVYDDYKWAKLEQELVQEWAGKFNDEVAPTVVDLEGDVVALTGSLDARYAQWRRILRTMFALETGAGTELAP